MPSIYSSARTELAKLLIYGLFRKIRVLAQDGVQIILVNRYGEAGWGAVRETLRKNPSVWSLAHRGRAVEMIAPLLLLSEDSSSWLRSKRGARLRGILTRDPRRSPDSSMTTTGENWVTL